MINNMLSQAYLRSILHYDQLTGLFNWKITDIYHYTGQIAGGFTCGYVRIDIDGQRYQAHRLAFIWMNGTSPECVDHINLNRSDNRWSNLRAATKAQNNQNAGTRRDNKLGIKGVVQKPNGKFTTQVTCNGKTVSRTFNTLDEAKSFAVSKRIEMHGEFANHG